jgi:ATP synthase protein I
MAPKDRSSKTSEFKAFDERVRQLRVDAGLARDERDGKGGARGLIGGAAVQVGIELVAGVIGGALLGYGLDQWLGTWPIFFLVLFFLGAAAGMLNAYRYLRRISEVPGDRTRDR